MLIIILAVLFIVYLLTLMKGSIGRFNPQLTQLLRISLFILTPVVTGIIIISTHNIFLRGYWFPRIFFWVVVIQMMVLFAFGDRDKLSWIESKVYGLIFYLPLCFIGFLLIPFIGIGFGLLFYVSFIGDNSFIIYSDQNIRIEKEGIEFMGPDPGLGVYVKEGVFCYRDTIFTNGYNEDKDRLSVRRINDSIYVFTHYSPGNEEIPGESEEFTYKLPSFR